MSSTSPHHTTLRTLNTYLISFDSAPISDPLALTRTIIESARIVGTRVLLAPLSPIPAFPFSSVPPHAFLLPPGIPASALLPYTCAALHTGEARLTAAVLCAGKPSIVVPCVGDQAFWAWTLHRAGVAARPVEKGLLYEGGKARDASKGVLVLKEAIEVALSQRVVENATMIGDKIGREVSPLSSLVHRTALIPGLLRLCRMGTRLVFIPSIGIYPC